MSCKAYDWLSSVGGVQNRGNRNGGAIPPTLSTWRKRLHLHGHYRYWVLIRKYPALCRLVSNTARKWRLLIVHERTQRVKKTRILFYQMGNVKQGRKGVSNTFVLHVWWQMFGKNCTAFACWYSPHSTRIIDFMSLRLLLVISAVCVAPPIVSSSKTE